MKISDRELDAKMAEALGHRVMPRPSPMEPCIMPPGGKPWQTIPHYTASIAAAFLVVEKLKDHSFTLSWMPGHKQWMATIRKNLSEENHMSITDTAPKAIVLAALSALGVEVGA